MEAKNVILLGGTGMIGGLALRQCLNDPEISRVTAIGRRGVGFQHAKLNEILLDTLMDYTAIADELEAVDLALYCLGVYSGTLRDEEFRRITVDWTAAFARALYARSPQATFSFLSGQGADPTEQSWMAFARYKGAAEKDLIRIGFPQVHIFRPGYIYPVTPRKEPNLAFRVLRTLYPAIRLVYPNIGVSSEDLALAMVYAGLNATEGQGSTVFENRDIRGLAAMRVAEETESPRPA